MTEHEFLKYAKDHGYIVIKDTRDEDFKNRLIDYILIDKDHFKKDTFFCPLSDLYTSVDYAKYEIDNKQLTIIDDAKDILHFYFAISLFCIEYEFIPNNLVYDCRRITDVSGTCFKDAEITYEFLTVDESKLMQVYEDVYKVYSVMQQK